MPLSGKLPRAHLSPEVDAFRHRHASDHRQLVLAVLLLEVVSIRVCADVTSDHPHSAVASCIDPCLRMHACTGQGIYGCCTGCESHPKTSCESWLRATNTCMCSCMQVAPVNMHASSACEHACSPSRNATNCGEQMKAGRRTQRPRGLFERSDDPLHHSSAPIPQRRGCVDREVHHRLL